MSFIRDQDPKKSMSIGKESILQEIDGVILTPDDSRRMNFTKLWNTSVIIEIKAGKYKIVKNRYGILNNNIYIEEKYLMDLLLKIREEFRNWQDNFEKIKI